MFSSAQECTFLLLSMRTPVATDLRAVVDAVQTGVEMERLAASATEIAYVVRRRYPDCSVPGRTATPTPSTRSCSVTATNDSPIARRGSPGEPFRTATEAHRLTLDH